MLKSDKIGLGGDGGSKKHKKRRTSFMYVPLTYILSKGQKNSKANYIDLIHPKNEEIMLPSFHRILSIVQKLMSVSLNFIVNTIVIQYCVYHEI